MLIRLPLADNAAWGISWSRTFPLTFDKHLNVARLPVPRLVEGGRDGKDRESEWKSESPEWEPHLPLELFSPFWTCPYPFVFFDIALIWLERGTWSAFRASLSPTHTHTHPFALFPFLTALAARSNFKVRATPNQTNGRCLWATGTIQMSCTRMKIGKSQERSKCAKG